MNLQEIGKRIYHFRTQILNLPQHDFAQRIGMGQSNVSSVEKEQTLPGCFFIWCLHTTYQIDLHWLFTGEGEPLYQQPVSAGIHLDQT
ncbi:helix-turn-helix transcriptional regulator [Cytophagaceae bacterium DM2B3-1]|uniref:Helix-turn-helix transcriptional regulator n=1 Tax=Xanthocytophaga flava TaxID=3048013 RepID=A0ABT7CMR0_9BACT|nr:helix-turn-helix transcriptional regulator [Xanthocytophaga flavus]MDJ1495026.1 helix-turn-helix transcriptional regulator [Xanthocytophaga flavus]